MSPAVLYMACKAVGAVLVIFAGLLVSAEYRRSVNDTISAARDAEKLIRHIGECIVYGGGEIGSIIASYDGGCASTRAIWRRASETTLPEALDGPGLPFDAQTHKLLRDFASQLGRGYREPQAELCRAFAGRIARRAEELESSKEDKLRASAAVSVFAALSAVIFFI